MDKELTCVYCKAECSYVNTTFIKRDETPPKQVTIAVPICSSLSCLVSRGATVVDHRELSWMRNAS